MQKENHYHTADLLHSIAIHLLRQVSVHDEHTGLTPRRLSVLSVIVFAGPITITQLAEAERVSAPTISRMIKDLEYEGLIEKVSGEQDKRTQHIQVTEKGKRLMKEGRLRRINALAKQLNTLPSADLDHLTQLIPLLQKIALPPNHPHRKDQDLL